jgi:hypothetical protein
MTQPVYLRRMRFWLAIIIVGLVLSGITAFPLQIELAWLVSFLRTSWLQPIDESVHLLPWVERVNEGLTATNADYPFLASRYRLARVCPFSDRCCVYRTLPRSDPQ